MLQRMLKLFRTSSRRLQQHVQQLTDELHELRGDLNNRLQQVEEECARIRLQRMLGGIHVAAELATRHGVQAALAIAAGLRAVIAPLPPGRAGGLARARRAWRYSDGTFMPESEKLEFYREEYERHAAGGRGRAANAKRNVFGHFMRA